MHRVGTKALIVGSAHVAPRDRLPDAVFDSVDLVIAADAGIAACRRLGLRPDMAVGDFDSAGPDELEALDASGIPVLRVPAEKDESDLELALAQAVERDARMVVVLGALGGPRIEHELSAIALVGHASDLGVGMSLVDERSSVSLLDAAGDGYGGRSRAARARPARARPARFTVEGAPGDFVSLFPFGGDAIGVTTEGLRYPLRDEDLPVGPSRGLSNELAGTRGEVICRHGRLLIVHTRRAALDSPRADGPAAAWPAQETERSPLA